MNCFVVMPFGNPRTESEKARRFAHIYTHWIKAAVEELVIGPDLPRIQCHRGDSDHRPGEVMAQVIRALSEADFVIADLTGQNCNVFYELGVRHALRNNAILIAQDIEDIPFDLRGQRAIPYRYEEPESLIALKSRLQNSLKDMLSSPTSIDNPVQRCLSDREFAKLGSSPDHAVRQLADQVKVLREELAVRVTEILTLVQNTTSRPQEASQATPGSIGVLAGAWTTLEHGGLYVFRLVGSELRGPYCYGSDDELTAHFFNIQVVGQQVLCRFRWLKGNIEGCALFTVVSKDRLVGGWWYIYELPTTARQDLTRLHVDLPSMNPLNLERIPMPQPLPRWVTDYYAKAERGEI